MSKLSGHLSSSLPCDGSGVVGRDVLRSRAHRLLVAGGDREAIRMRRRLGFGSAMVGVHTWLPRPPESDARRNWELAWAAVGGGFP